ncbi:MAG: signal peptidase I, partial [Opitutales bacterium]|nr:signal peptidase I [Opitutales bacterium]
KVYHYRRDVMAAADITTLRNCASTLEAAYRDKKTKEADLEAALHAQHEILSKVGGEIYPVRFVNDNVETLLAIAIVILSFRLFFFQPFVIPTSSMYPTYFGREPDAVSQSEKAPPIHQRILRKVLRGASHYKVEAKASGTISIPLGGNPERGTIHGFDWKQVRGRKWAGLLPADYREYTIYVGDTRHTIRVPLEFNLDNVLLEAFFPEAESLADAYRSLVNKRDGITFENGRVRLSTLKEATKGQSILRFDILMGDALFVNRFWYHFAPPKAGDPIVFRTGGFANRAGYPSMLTDDKYYIKRLAGMPGQKLDVKNHTLFADGVPASGAGAFDKNAQQVEDYPGYTNVGLLQAGMSYEVPQGTYFAMGDNSSNSFDSRYFGPVPEKEVIGKAAFIYFPFTKRWGPAK